MSYREDSVVRRCVLDGGTLLVAHGMHLELVGLGQGGEVLGGQHLGAVVVHVGAAVVLHLGAKGE